MRAFGQVWKVVRDIWSDRLLLLSLSLKDFERKFSGTYFGIFWALAQPLQEGLRCCTYPTILIR